MSGGLALADFAFTGEDLEHAGYSVSSAGDVDGDELDDLRMADDGTYAGKAYLLLGSNAE